MRGVFTLSTRVPVRVALPVARVSVRRVRVPCTVRTAAPAPLAGIALRRSSDPLEATRYPGRAASRLQAVLATLSHAGPRVTVALLRLTFGPSYSNVSNAPVIV